MKIKNLVVAAYAPMHKDQTLNLDLIGLYNAGDEFKPLLPITDDMIGRNPALDQTTEGNKLLSKQYYLS